MMLTRCLLGVLGLGVAISATASAQLAAAATVDARARAMAALAANPALVADPAGLLVRFRPEAPGTARELALALADAQVAQEYWLVPGLTKVTVGGGAGLDAGRALTILRGNPAVLYAEPDYVVRHTVVPNDPAFGLLWGMRNTGQTVNGFVGTAGADIRAAEAWDVLTGAPGFVIADIDTGLQVTHPDLAANLWVNPGEVAGNGIDDDANGYVDDINGWDFWDRDNTPQDSGSHGTHTAGTIGAVGNNGIGVAGVAWSCRIMVLKFLGPSGGYTSDAVLAIQYAAGMNVRLSNNSWGGGGFNQALYDAINASKSVNHLFVAAAGNSGVNTDSSPHYPSSYNLDNIVSVAATDARDNRASFSNYGLNSVDLGAPGVNTYSTVPTNSYGYKNGTSMATPHVTGVAALLGFQNPTWTYQQVRSRILSTVRPVSSLNGITATGGVLNAAAALGGGAPINTAPVVTISSPTSGSSFVSGGAVTFTGSALDTQDGNISASLAWTSSLQGAIGSGASFSRSDLLVGTHTITASVIDSGGLPGSASVTVTITSTAQPPAAPSNVAGSSPSPGVAVVTWTDNSGNETGFEVERQTRLGNQWSGSTLAGTAAPNATSFQMSLPTDRYRFRVRAVNANGPSAWSAWTGTVRVR